MAIDRERKERHPGFYRKEKPAKAARPSGAGMKSSRRADRTDPPSQGPIRIFFDDEREMPEGFVVARTLPALEKLLDTVDMPRVQTICLDWHLGINAEPGQSGHDAVRMIAARIDADPTRFSDLRSVWMHSTDIQQAGEMARTLVRTLEPHQANGLLNDVYVVVDKYVPGMGL